MKKDKDMKRGDIDFQYTNNAVDVKWFGQKTAAYKLDRKSSGGRYHLRRFFDFINISL